MEQDEASLQQAGGSVGLTARSLARSLVGPEALTPVLCTWEPGNHWHPATPRHLSCGLEEGNKKSQVQGQKQLRSTGEVGKSESCY